MAGDVFNVSDGEFKKEVLDSAQPVLVDFWATWCAPCRNLTPVMEELASQFKGRARIAKVNVDENQQTAEQYSIRHLPTLLVFKGGQVVAQIVGAAPKARLEAELSKVV